MKTFVRNHLLPLLIILQIMALGFPERANADHHETNGLCACGQMLVADSGGGGGNSGIYGPTPPPGMPKGFHCGPSDGKPGVQKLGTHVWNWSKFSDFNQADNCFTRVTCDCGYTIDPLTGVCGVIPEGKPGSLQKKPSFKVGSNHRQLLFSYYDDFSSDTPGIKCFEDNNCDCGQRADAQKGMCAVMPAMPPMYKNRQNGRDVLNRPIITYNFSKTGDLDEDCFVKSSEGAGNCPNCKVGPNAAALGPSPCQGNPINCGMAAKDEEYVLFPYTGADQLGLKMKYRSLNGGQKPLTAVDMGYARGWEFSELIKLSPVTGGLVGISYAGYHTKFFNFSNGIYTGTTPESGNLLKIPGGWLLIELDGTRLTFDANGYLIQRTLVGGGTVYFGYDVQNPQTREFLLTSITDRQGQKIVILYDGQWHVQYVGKPNTAVYAFYYAYAFGGILGPLSSIDGPFTNQEPVYEQGTNRQIIDVHTRAFLYGSNALYYNLPQSFNYMLSYVFDYTTHYVGSTYTTHDMTLSMFDYNGLGQAVSTQHGDPNSYNADLVQVSYSDGYHFSAKTYTNSIASTSKNYTVGVVNGTPQITTISWQDGDTNQTVSENYLYDSFGHLTQKTDAKGIVTKYTFDARGNLLTRIEASNTVLARTITKKWAANYSIPTQIDNGQLQINFVYDETGKLLTRTAIDKGTGEKRTTSLAYDTSGRLASVNGPREDVNDITTLTYDGRGNLEVVKNALGQRMQLMDYDYIGRPRLIVDVNGVGTTLEYDTFDNITSATKNGNRWTYRYAKSDRLAGVTDPNGRSFTLNYNLAGKLYSLTDVSTGSHIDLVLNAQGNALQSSILDAQNNVLRSTDQQYNPLGILTKNVDSYGNATSFGHDPIGNITSVTDALGYVSTAKYDALGRVTEYIDALGNGDKMSYNNYDKIVQEINPRGLKSTYSYNGFGEKTKSVTPDSGEDIFGYDKAGNLVYHRDARGVINNRTYDALNRLTGSTYASVPYSNTVLSGIHGLADETSLAYFYDGSNDPQIPYGTGRLTGIRGSQSNIVYRYDARGDMIQEIRQLGDSTLVTAYAYDRMHKVTRIDYPGGLVVGYARNLQEHVTEVTARRNGVTSIVASKITYEPIPGGKLLSYTRGTLGMPIKNTYDLSGRLVSQTAPQAVGSQSIDFGLQRSYIYDERGLIRKIRDSSSTLYLQQTNNGSGTAALRPPREYQFTYDPARRLIQANGYWGQITYQYDPVGNRTQKVFSPATASAQIPNAMNPTGNVNTDMPTVTTYSYDSLSNELTSLIQSGSTTAFKNFAYSASGQLVQAGNLTLGYGGTDRDIAASNTAIGEFAMMQMHYAPEGWRDAKASGNSLSRYSYDRSGHMIEETNAAVAAGSQQIANISSMLQNSGVSQAQQAGNQIAATQATGSQVSSPANRQIIWLENIPLAVIQSRKQGSEPETFDLYVGNTGQPLRATDAGGMVAWERSELPFGEDWQDPQPAVALNQAGVVNQAIFLANMGASTGSAMELPLRFPGQYADPETKLIQNWHRTYDPTMGRYIQADPMDLLAGNNRFAYALANPISLIDAPGLCASEGFGNNMLNNILETQEVGRSLNNSLPTALTSFSSDDGGMYYDGSMSGDVGGAVFRASAIAGASRITGIPGPLGFVWSGAVARAPGFIYPVGAQAVIAPLAAEGFLELGNIAGSALNSIPTGQNETLRDTLAGNDCGCGSGATLGDIPDIIMTGLINVGTPRI